MLINVDAQNHRLTSDPKENNNILRSRTSAITGPLRIRDKIMHKDSQNIFETKRAAL
jgi:hypothetical protein